MANKALKFRIDPNKEQAVLMEKTFGCCRFVYNHILADKKEAYEKEGKNLRITPASYKKEYPWLKEVDSLALVNAQLHLEQAYQRFFADPKKHGFPRFKAKHHSRRSYTTNVVNGNIRIEDKKLRLPKLGLVRMRQHRPIPEGWKLKSVTVSRESNGKYFASLLYEYPDCENQAVQKPAEERLAREQRKLSHCQKGGKNYAKQRQRVARCHERIRNQRKDFQHKLSLQIAQAYDAVAVEDLDMQAMSRSLHFGKSVMDNGFGTFRTMLAYKLEDRGKKLIVVDRFYPSSKRCSVCGNVKKELRLDERIYRCSCGNCMDRDVNAAVNLREEGRRLLSLPEPERLCA